MARLDLLLVASAGMGERLLVSHFYAHPVGHAVEALHYAHGHWRPDTSREVSVLLNARTPVELAGLCPWVTRAYAVDHPLLERCADSPARLAHVPREWDWVLDDGRRYQDWQLELFPGLREFSAASDEWFACRVGRSVSGQHRAGYAQAPWRFQIPRQAADAATETLNGTGPRIALMPAGSSGPEHYPSTASWHLVLDGLLEAFGPDLQVVLIGKSSDEDGRTATAGAGRYMTLRDHPVTPMSAYDRPLVEQLALVEACDAFLSPHTGFGLAALACGTPWLTLSGGRWWEYFFNGVPFRSILPDGAHASGSFAALEPEPLAADGDAERSVSMTQARIRADVPRIVRAAQELVNGTLSYERAIAEYYAELRTRVEPAAVWSIDNVHVAYL